MLYNLFHGLFEAFKWLIIGTSIMTALGLVFVGIPAYRGQRRHTRYLHAKELKRYEKEMSAQHATFYDKEDEDFFENIQRHVFENEIEKPFQQQENRVFDTSIDAVLRDEAMRFLAGDNNAFVQPPTLFEETVGRAIQSGEYPGQDQPRLLRDKTTTFLKNTDGDTDGFPKLP